MCDEILLADGWQEIYLAKYLSTCEENKLPSKAELQKMLGRIIEIYETRERRQTVVVDSYGGIVEDEGCS